MTSKPSKVIQRPLVEGEDFYFNAAGYMVFTEMYHLKRGHCCKSGCSHCPFGYKAGVKQGIQASKEE